MAVIFEKAAAEHAFWLRFWRRVLATLELVGGLCGLYGAATGRPIFLPALFLFVVAVCGGVLLFLGRRGGVALSLIVQTLQIVQISTSTVLYSFVCGMQVLVSPAGEVGAGILTVRGPAQFYAASNPSSVLPGGGVSGLDIAAAVGIGFLLYVRTQERTQGGGDRQENVLSQPNGVWPPAPKT